MRRERDWSATQAHEALHVGLGLGAKSRAAYVAIEDGRPLREREQEYLRGYFGGGPTDEDRDPSAGTEANVPADLASAIRELVEELRASRLARVDLEERVGALETAAKLRDRPTVGGGGGKPAPRQTTESA